MKKLLIILILPLTFLTSCFYSNYPQNGSATYPKTNPEEILIYSKDIDQHYEVIGIVGTDVIGSDNNAIENLKKKASKKGADAIIHVKLSHANSYSPRTGVSGIAVKLTETTAINL